LEKHQEDLGSVHDAAFELLLKESETRMIDIADLSVRDAFIIASAQCVEHYEIALYGTLVEWATEMEHEEDRDLLETSLAEEESADQKLSGIATGGLFTSGINKDASKGETSRTDSSLADEIL
jgi:ferritin-like metal-binding protein YciE